MAFKIELQERFKPWLNAPENSYESIVTRIFSLFSKKNIGLQFTQESKHIVPSIYMGLRYKLLRQTAESMTAAVVFFKRSTSGTKFGFFLIFIPANSAGLYYLLFIQFSSSFNYGLRLYEQLIIIANWTLLELVTLKVALSLKYEKGLIRFGKLQPISVEVGGGIFGMILVMPLLMMSLLVSVESILSSGPVLLLQFITSFCLTFFLGLLIGVSLSRITKKRDLKFVIPVFFKGFFLLSPMFNRNTESPGLLSFFSELSIINAPLKISSIGYSTYYFPTILLITLYLGQIAFFWIVIYSARKRGNLEKPDMRAMWNEIG